MFLTFYLPTKNNPTEQLKVSQSVFNGPRGTSKEGPMTHNSSRTPNESSQFEAGVPHLCFGLGDNLMAIPLSEVKEVIGKIEVTPLPQSPPL